MKNKILLSFVLMFAFLFAGCAESEALEDTEEYQAGYAAGYEDGRESVWIEIEEDYKNNPDSVYEPVVVETDDIYPLMYYVDTKETPLNIREEPQQDSKILGEIPKGANIEISDEFNGFGYVVYGDVEGWVNLDYCTEGENPNPPAEYSGETVYVTDTGSKYHKSGCSYLKSKNEISLDEAERRGYEPCSRCY